ncbi:MAG: hypothetical protein RBS48_04410 [Ignavibacteriaceae bacterium]|nr:hypothetical protein [Ignavibacteriaceae bacterium]
MKTKSLYLKIFAALSYIVMIIANYLANALPLNGYTTGELSDMYHNLFTPVGFTFSIWGIIYLLLLVFLIYYIVASSKILDSIKKEKIDNIALLFIITSLINASWIFAWHFRFVGLSVLLMLGFLLSLIRVADIVNTLSLTKTERVTIKMPFGIYFGWITVATIANITAFLVSLGWSGFGIQDWVWMIVIALVGAVIGNLRGFKDQCGAYILVFIWAYSGILYKHLSVNGFNGEYPFIIGTIILCLISFVITIVLLANKIRKLQTN